MSAAMEIECLPALDAAREAEWRGFLAAAARQHPRQDPAFAEVERAEGAVPEAVA